MRWSWPIFGTLLGGGLGFLTMPLSYLGRSEPWWVHAWPAFGATLGFGMGVVADRFKLR